MIHTQAIAVGKPNVDEWQKSDRRAKLTAVVHSSVMSCALQSRNATTQVVLYIFLSSKVAVTVIQSPLWCLEPNPECSTWYISVASNSIMP